MEMCHKEANQHSKQNLELELIQIVLANRDILDPLIKAWVLQAGTWEQTRSRASLLIHGGQRLIEGGEGVHDVVKVILEPPEVVGDLGGGGGDGVGVGLGRCQAQRRRGQVKLRRAHRTLEGGGHVGEVNQGRGGVQLWQRHVGPGQGQVHGAPGGGGRIDAVRCHNMRDRSGWRFVRN